MSLNVRCQLQKPGQAWLGAGCRHLPPPTLSESSYTYQLRSRALECAHSQSLIHPARENWKEDQPEGGEGSWESLDLPRPSAALRPLGIFPGAPSGSPRPLGGLTSCCSAGSPSLLNQGLGPHCHRDRVFTRATSEERLVRTSLKLLISSSPPVFLSKALFAL